MRCFYTKIFQVTIFAFPIYALLSSRVLVGQEALEIDKAVLQIHEPIEIASPTSGILYRSLASEGVLVKAGDTIAELDKSREELEVRRLQVELEILEEQSNSQVDIEYAKKVILVSQAELKRATDLNQQVSRLVSRSEIERLQLVLERSNAELEKTKFTIQMLGLNKQIKSIELERSRLDLERRNIKIPVSGRIEDVYKRKGEWVETGQPVAKLIRLDVLRAEVKIDGALGDGRLEGNRVQFFPHAHWLAGEAFEGSVQFIQSQLNPVDSAHRAWILIDNSELKLRPGITGRIVIDLAAQSD